MKIFYKLINVGTGVLNITEENLVKKEIPRFSNDIIDVNGIFTNISSSNFTGTEIPLNKKTTRFNTLTAQSATVYTLSTSQILGADAKIWINTTSEPIITGAVQTGGVTWEANTNMDLIVQVEGGRVIYFFVTRVIPT